MLREAEKLAQRMKADVHIYEGERLKTIGTPAQNSLSSDGVKYDKQSHCSSM